MNAQQLYDKGFDLRCSGNYREAKAVFQQILRQEQSHLDAQWQLALIAGFEGDFEQSKSLLSKIVEIDSNHIGARYDLAMTLMMLGMDGDACAHFHEILRQNPSHEKAKQQIIYCS